MEQDYTRATREESSRWKSYAPDPRRLSADSLAQAICGAFHREFVTAYVALIDALEKKDRYTANHSRRVAVLAFRVCLLLGLSREQTEETLLAAAFHDIGKVGISDALLRKAGPLTQEEYAAVQRHCAIGAHILGKNRGLERVAEDVRHHHERWDGRGYPDRLGGESIPLASRILAVCDSIDAMRADRPYRQGLSDQVCREEIGRNAGVMYDPRLVTLCLNNWAYLTDGMHNAA